LGFVCKDLSDYGVTWDEAKPNFEAALRQADWFSRLGELERPFSRETIDKYWKTTSDHPSLPRTLAALSYLGLNRILGTIPALRFPNAVWFALMAAVVFHWTASKWTIQAGFAALAALLLMPRLFSEAHILSLDLPITALWVLTAWAFVKGLESWGWGVATGILYAIAVTTKLHAFFLPFPLVAWTLWRAHKHWYRPVLPMAVLAPVFYVGLQPWLWFDTGTRLAERFFHYADKSVGNPIKLFYFGQLYSNNTPWHYSIVLILVTVPILTLVLSLIGISRVWVHRHAEPDGILLLLLFLVPPCLLFLPRAQGYDGTRLFMECFPFLACLSGIGWEQLRTRMLHKVGLDRMKARRILIVLTFVWLIPICVQMVLLHPCQLGYYNELIGSLPGARLVGMESTYWCDAITPDLIEEMNTALPENSHVVTMSMSVAVLPFYQQVGLLRSDLRLDVPDTPADFHLLQCRQGMFGQIEWYYYKTRTPIYRVERFGVPLMLLFSEEQ
ncbi:MAG TPA: glycosyltransferase family 39 protein, partial [bacterium]|nr:glycosyltransferase family 39 protein [bacterium]